MIYHMIVEQTKAYKNRIKYDDINNRFYETEFLSLFHARNCPYPYGWVAETGTPPNFHLDVILVSDQTYELGERVSIKLIGVFKRADDDHKLVAVPYESQLDDISQLDGAGFEKLVVLYPEIGEDEGWFGAEEANVVMEGVINE